MKEDVFTGELTNRKITNFVWPSILMMFVLALYYTVDSIFVANLVSEQALAALNIAYPIQGIMWGVAVMLAAGSSSLVAIKQGMDEHEKANDMFTFIVVFAIVLGIACSLLMFIFMDPIVTVLGAGDTLAAGCREFLLIFLIGCPFALSGVCLEFFIRVDGRPAFTIALYVCGGVVHLLLDYILMGPLEMGLTGTAIANVAGLATTALVGAWYFIFRETRLNFSRFTVDMIYVGRSFSNGSPEFVNESGTGIIIFFYNMVAINLAGDTGVAAAAIILDLLYLFLSVQMGYSAGVLPLLSFFYGAKDTVKINKVMKYTRWFILFSSLIMATIVFFGAEWFVMIYERPGSELYDMSVVGLKIAAFQVLLTGVNIFASNFFTAFGDGVFSAIISVSRGLVILIPALFILAHFFGLVGAWLALPVAEALTLIMSFGIMNGKKKKYGYKVLGE